MSRWLLPAAALLLASGCGEGEPNVAAVEPEPPMEMTPEVAEHPDLANDAASAEAEDAAIGGVVNESDVSARR